ncbi:MAG: 23S rRNA (uracil(1939)-C(5))-methyltransferase RlmD [Clostridia bacterium]|nr:23S rRNA (uracil(1939)-C(5))-methyltransferase RlmD [Clostridia bacterium]
MIIIIPVKKNHEYTVEIETLSSEGSGIARVEGYTLFVAGALAGDTARVLCTKLNKNYGFARLVKLISPSPVRTSPECATFSDCGGCQLMHMSYEGQLEFKRQTVRDALKRIGGISLEPDIIGMETPFRYRNKMVFPIGKGGSWGFYRERSHEVICLKDCLLGDSLNHEIMNTVSEHIKKYNISVYNELEHMGSIRRVFIRSSRDEFMVVISANADDIPHKNELIKSITAISPKITSIILNVNKKRTNLVLGDKNITLWGKDKLTDTLCGLDYEISPHSFFQVNPIQTEKLYSTAISFADISNQDTVMDIYCGIGTISLTAAKHAKAVIGIEIVPQAIEDAKKNAALNGIENAEFFCSAAEDIVPHLIEKKTTPDIVILDPPRKGSDEKTLSAIVSAKPKRIVYVSCNPATLARDAKFLTENGYIAVKATAVDMFPHTTHVETVMLLIKE